MFSLINILKSLSLLHGCSIQILRCFPGVRNNQRSVNFQRWCFFFFLSKEEIRSLEFFENCRCLQAQWWKVKLILDQWNFPSGDVSSMESKCWASENFLSVDLLEILLSVGKKIFYDKIVWVSTEGSLWVFPLYDNFDEQFSSGQFFEGPGIFLRNYSST